MHSRLVIASLVAAVMVVGCDDKEKTVKEQDKPEQSVEVGWQPPEGYWAATPPPPPPKETKVVAVVRDLGPPPPPPAPPSPPPPPPPVVEKAPEKPGPDQVDVTLDRLAKRRAAGPMRVGPVEVAEMVPPPEYETSDPDYSREKPITVTSSYPVDRSFTLTPDRRVSAVLLDGINTQLEGQVRAQVTQDIFGGDDKFKLLEKGDVLLGRYKPLQKVGDTRVNVVFNRVIRQADGAHLYFEKGLGYAADKMGRTGLIGDVDNRNWDRYGHAVMSATVGALAGAGMKAGSETSGATGAFGEKISEQFGVITAKILEQTGAMAPIVTVAQGEEFLVQLSADFVMRRPVIKKKG